MINSIYEIKNNLNKTYFILNIDNKLYYTSKYNSFYIFNKDEIFYNLSNDINEIFQKEIIKSRKISIIDVLNTIYLDDYFKYKYILFYDKTICLYKFNIKNYILTQKIKNIND